MDIPVFFQRYFINPIIYNSGYNIVNTTVYAIIAIFAVYIIYLWLDKKLKFKINHKFIYYILPFVLLGSTMHVITDGIEVGVFKQYISNSPEGIIYWIYKAMLNSHIYDYGYLTVTPGIYIVISIIFLISLYVFHRLNKINYLILFGLILWLPHILVLIPLMNYFMYGLLILLITTSISVIGYHILKWLDISKYYLPILIGHSLDGTATFVSINVFNNLSPLCTELGRCYGEKHVMASSIGSNYSYLLFLLIKIAISLGIIYLISREKGLKEKDKWFIVAVLAVAGFAPGLRDMLRLMAGT